MSEAHPTETTRDYPQDEFEAWSEKLANSSMTLAPGVNAETLASEFGQLTDAIRDELCSDVVMIAMEDGHHDQIPLQAFREAYENHPETPLEHDDSTQQQSQDDTQHAVDADPEQDSTDTDVDAHDPTPDTAGPVEETTPKQDDQPAEDSDVGDDVGAMPRDELEAEVQTLRDRVDDLEDTVQESHAIIQAVRRQMKVQSQLLVGEDTIAAAVDVDDVRSHHQQLIDLEQDVQEQGDKIQMVRTDGGGGNDDPDSRAQLIRQTLYNKAKQNSEGQAAMDRDDVDSRLGGGLHKDSVLDAMKRAADGIDAERDNRDYQAIGGSSDLQPVESITFTVGGGRGTQSKLVMNLDDATGAEIRQNLTTQIEQEAA